MALIQPGVTPGKGIYGSSIARPTKWRDRSRIMRFTSDSPKKSPFIMVASVFSNREYLFSQWFENHQRLQFPRSQQHLFWLASSPNKKFEDLIMNVFDGLDGYHSKTLLLDPDVPIFKEGGSNPSQWVQRNEGVTSAWNVVRSHVDYVDYTFLYEDDVLVPPDALQKMLPLMNNQHIGAIVARCPYRPDGINRGKPLAWHIQPVYQIMNGTVDQSYEVKFMDSQDDGVEEIGGGTTGCQLIRGDIFRKIAFINDYKGISGPDVSYGQQLREWGYKTLIHWGVHCGHMNLNGKGIEIFQ